MQCRCKVGAMQALVQCWCNAGACAMFVQYRGNIWFNIMAGAIFVCDYSGAILFLVNNSR